jgi:hypothetical protein
MLLRLHAPRLDLVPGLPTTWCPDSARPGAGT